MKLWPEESIQHFRVSWINKACACIFVLVGWRRFFCKVFPWKLALNILLAWSYCGMWKREKEWGRRRREEARGKEMGDKCVCKTSEGVHTIGIKSRHQMELERPKIQIGVWIQVIHHTSKFKQKAFVDCNKMSLNCWIESIWLSQVFWSVNGTVFDLNFSHSLFSFVI